MKHLFNNSKQKDFRRNLRNNQTEAEQLLWGHLRKKQFFNLRFLRQYGAGKYILDFYCPEKRFAIELDGSQHLEEKNMKYDKKRTEYLNSINIKVFRVFNNDVMSNIDSVLEGIYHEIFKHSEEK